MHNTANPGDLPVAPSRERGSKRCYYKMAGNLAGRAIAPFFAGCICRIHPAIFSFWAGVIPPMPWSVGRCCMSMAIAWRGPEPLRWFQ